MLIVPMAIPERKKSNASHNIIRIFKIALAKTGIQGFHFHDLRHTFAHYWRKEGLTFIKYQSC